MARRKKNDDKRSFDVGCGSSLDLRLCETTDGGVVIVMPSISMFVEITQENAKDLLPLLQHFAETGRLPEGEKE